MYLAEVLLDSSLGAFVRELMFYSTTHIDDEAVQLHRPKLRLQRHAVLANAQSETDTEQTRRAYPSNTSSTLFLTLSPTSFHPTYSSHQLSVKNFRSVSSVMRQTSWRSASKCSSVSGMPPQNSDATDA